MGVSRLTKYLHWTLASFDDLLPDNYEFVCNLGLPNWLRVSGDSKARATLVQLDECLMRSR